MTYTFVYIPILVLHHFVHMPMKIFSIQCDDSFAAVLLKLVLICILFNIDTHRGCTGPSRSSDVIDQIQTGTANKVTYKDYLDRVSDD